MRVLWSNTEILQEFLRQHLEKGLEKQPVHDSTCKTRLERTVSSVTRGMNNSRSILSVQLETEIEHLVC